MAETPNVRARTILIEGSHADDRAPRIGESYFTVFAHSRHIQQSCQVDSSDRGRNERRDTAWAEA